MLRGMKTLSCVAVAVTVGVTCYCSKPMEKPGSPEDVYRRFMISNLTGSEKAIRPLIIDNPDAALLWTGGAYPEQVASALEKQYREMKVVRIAEEDDRVMLKSPAVPVAMEVRRVNGEWRLDAAPIIKFRKKSP